ncbi:hypothetical protein DYB37_011354 [Aphanomyces astaci]|uniref:Clathrin/coatomer adaptor adaptin-like N-terminal domain-containing protein n=1 Tax=Aphanomyces astaci TaxID=112090 RepID=A0A3R7CIV4_APHAT|nr:hypothetical protein DYB35_013290 [Aphanomyces astaci]RHZ27417.1 hypothetical protein DYB37_011354 [Aphanomyces astaci]
MGHVRQLNLDMLFELALPGIGHAWAPLHRHAHRILRALVLMYSKDRPIQASEMGAVYIRRMVTTFTRPDDIKDMAMGVLAMTADAALVRFALVEICDKWACDRVRSEPLATLLFELLKVLPSRDLPFALVVVEKMMWEEPTIMPTVYQAIAGPCDASRRIVLLEWYLRLHAQIAPAVTWHSRL